MGFKYFFFFLFAAVALSKFSGPSNIFSSGESYAKRLTASQGKDGLFGNLGQTYFSIQSLQLLKKKIPEEATICKTLKNNLASYSSASDLYYSLSLLASLKCNFAADKETLGKVQNLLKASSIKELHYGVATLAALNALQSEATQLKNVARKILELKEEDGSFRSTSDSTEGTNLDAGLAFLTLSHAYKLVIDEHKSDIQQLAFDIYQLFGRATTKNGFLYFVDDNSDPHLNLEATARVFQGINTLGGSVEKIDVSQEQVARLTEFFIQNQHVQEPHDIYFTLLGIFTAANNKFHLPLVSTVTSETLVAKGSDNNIRVRLTDIFGNFATQAKIVVSSIAPFNNPKNVIVKGQDLYAEGKTGQNTLYSFNFLAFKPEPGLYTVIYTVTPTDQKYISSSEEGTVKVVTAVSLYDCLIQTTDSADQGSKLGDANKFRCDSPLDEVISTVFTKYVKVSFKLRNQATGKPLQVHQAFVRLSNAEKNQEQIFIASYGDKSNYVANLDLSTSNLGKLGLLSGKYSLDILVGDAFIQTPSVYPLANVDALSDAKPSPSKLAPKPQITHIFRQPEKRPPQIFSLAFTGAVLSPLLVLFVGLGKVGANFGNFPGGVSFLSAVGFQISLGALLFVFVLFWLALDMFQALALLAVAGGVTAFFGQRTLLALSASR